MGTSQSIRPAMKAAPSKRTPLQSTNSNTHTRAAQGRTETPGHLHEATLTERVLGFLDRYRPAYGFQ